MVPWTIVSSVHGIFQTTILEWGVISSSRRSSCSRDQTHISCVFCTGRWILYHWSHLWSQAFKLQGSNKCIQLSLFKGIFFFPLEVTQLKWNVYHLRDTYFFTHWCCIYLMEKTRKTGKSLTQSPSQVVVLTQGSIKQLHIFFHQMQTLLEKPIHLVTVV